jgi:hypothetical protein
MTQIETIARAGGKPRTGGGDRHREALHGCAGKAEDACG